MKGILAHGCKAAREKKSDNSDDQEQGMIKKSLGHVIL